MTKKALTIHIDSGVIDDFRNYCRLNALKLSAKVELLLKREMETAPGNPTLVKLFEEIIKKQNFKLASEEPGQTKIQEKIDPQQGLLQNQGTAQIIQPKIDKVPSIEHLKRVKGL